MLEPWQWKEYFAAQALYCGKCKHDGCVSAQFPARFIMAR